LAPLCGLPGRQSESVDFSDSAPILAKKPNGTYPCSGNIKTNDNDLAHLGVKSSLTLSKYTRNSMTVTIKTAAEIEAMREAGRLASEVLEMIEPHVVPGVSTGELDRICHDYIVNVQHAIP